MPLFIATCCSYVCREYRSQRFCWKARNPCRTVGMAWATHQPISITENSSLCVPLVSNGYITASRQHQWTGSATFSQMILSRLWGYLIGIRTRHAVNVDILLKDSKGMLSDDFNHFQRCAFLLEIFMKRQDTRTTDEDDPYISS